MPGVTLPLCWFLGIYLSVMVLEVDMGLVARKTYALIPVLFYGPSNSIHISNIIFLVVETIECTRRALFEIAEGLGL